MTLTDSLKKHILHKDPHEPSSSHPQRNVLTKPPPPSHPAAGPPADDDDARRGHGDAHPGHVGAREKELPSPPPLAVARERGGGGEPHYPPTQHGTENTVMPGAYPASAGSQPPSPQRDQDTGITAATGATRRPPVAGEVGFQFAPRGPLGAAPQDGRDARATAPPPQHPAHPPLKHKPSLENLTVADLLGVSDPSPTSGPDPTTADLPPNLPVTLQNTTDTTVRETVAPAVTHETLTHDRREIRHEKVTRDVHVREYVTRVLPVVEREYLPARHFVRELDPRGGGAGRVQELGVGEEIPVDINGERLTPVEREFVWVEERLPGSTAVGGVEGAGAGAGVGAEARL